MKGNSEVVQHLNKQLANEQSAVNQYLLHSQQLKEWGIKKMAKARQEYLELGERGAEMADKLAYEIDYLSKWVASKLGAGETRSLVKQTIHDMRVEGDAKAVGRVVGALMKTRDDLDGALVNRLAREELGAT